MTDFFISYTHADAKWAEWIAYILEEEGFSTIIQAWDFRPGSNFVLEMQNAATTAARTIMVLSPNYLNSKMAAPEWASAFAQDPQGLERRLIPVMVRKCEPGGLLPTIVQIRVVGLSEDVAKDAIIAGVRDARAKPSKRPIFPGTGIDPVPHKAFPGAATELTRKSVIPRMPRQWTDADRKRFLKDGFAEIRTIFEKNLKQADEEEPRVEVDFTPTSPFDFSAEIFIDGNSKARCRVWLANDFGSQSIRFQEGNTTGDAFNESLYPSTDGEPSLFATMALSDIEFKRIFDIKKLTAERAAAYLWMKFVKPLSY
ncbi:toll/interleukin-1 receptor domain-containing protein [Rhizobium johnstonii]|uniref:toll/interleukin-1 receptor domain-containing protein n=1 Tax=Rhizobium johnstonii TaxID=3019933 RepID=UPI003F9B06B5